MSGENEETKMYLRLILLLIEVATEILCRAFKHYALQTSEAVRQTCDTASKVACQTGEAVVSENAPEANEDAHHRSKETHQTSEDACQANEEVKAFLSAHETRGKLNKLKWEKKLIDFQFHMVTANNPRIEKFDISLLITLLCNLFDGTIEPPEKGWKNNKPAPQDLTFGADLIRLKNYRNKIVGHSACARISDHLFHKYWNDLESILIRICRKICPSEEAKIIEKVRTYERKKIDYQTEELCKAAIQDLREEIVQLQEQVKELISTTEEFTKFFETRPERYNRYIRLLFKGGQMVLSAILQRECSKRGQDINILVRQNLEAVRKELGVDDNLQSLQVTNAEKWDILHLSTIIIRLFKDTLKSKETRHIRALLDARKEYAKIALESLDEVSFSNRQLDLVQSLLYLSHELGEKIADECEKCIDDNRVGKERPDNDTYEEYFEHLKEHGVGIKNLSDVYKDKLNDLKEAFKKMEDMDIEFIKKPVFELKMITLGTDEQKRKFAEQTLETVWRAALEGTENSDSFDDVNQAVGKILEVIRKLGIRVADIQTKCIVLSLICPSPRSVLELLEYIESTHFQEQCFLVSYELCDIYEDTVAVSANLTIESLCAVLKNPRGEVDEASSSEDLTFPLEFDSVKRIHQVLDFVEAESTKTSLSTIADKLSEKVDDNISLKLEVDLRCLSEIFSRKEDTCSREGASVKPLPIDPRQLSLKDHTKRKDTGEISGIDIRKKHHLLGPSVKTTPVKPLTCEAEVLLEEKNEGEVGGTNMKKKPSVLGPPLETMSVQLSPSEAEVPLEIENKGVVGGTDTKKTHHLLGPVSVQPSTTEAEVRLEEETEDSLLNTEVYYKMGNAKDKIAEAQEQFDFRTVLDAVWEDLLDELELDPVLKELEKSKVFRRTELRDIQERHSTTEKIHVLLQGLREGDYTRYVQFKRCLGDSGQQRLVDITEKAERGEYKPAVRKEPMIEEEDLLGDLIAYYLEYESTMPVAQLVEQNGAELTSFYVRPPMKAYKKPSAFGQVKQSTKQEKTNISSYRELLFSDSGSYRRIYLTADAGLGKTLFSKMLARTWCQAHKPDKYVADRFSQGDLDTMRNFEFLFLIKLREYQGTNICCVDDMVVTMLQSKLPRASSYTKRFVEQVLCNRQCLIIVDGLDEWSHPQHTSSQALPMEVIPHTTRLPDCCSVLTTTRSWKLSDAQLSGKDMDRQVEILELDETAAHELESRAIEIMIEIQGQNGQVAANSKTKTVTDFENSMPEKILGHILYIPFVLLQMICLWFGNNPVGKSLCEVYSNIIELTLTRWLVKTDSGHTVCECEPLKGYENIKLKCMEKNRHCQRYMPLLLKIGQLAFLTLFDVIRESLLFDKRQVFEYLCAEELKQCLDMGLLSQIKYMTSIAEVRLQLYIPHKTLHEFFCALFVAKNWNNLNTGTMSIKQTISNKCTSVSDILKMSEVFVFVCGLNPEVYSDVSRHLAAIVSTDQSVIKYRNGVEEYSGLLQDYQVMQISCFLESIRNQHPECKIMIEDIILDGWRYANMEEDEKQALERILSDSASSMKSCTLHLRPAGEIVHILEHAEFPCLERLSVQECELTVFQSVLTTAAHTLKYLKLGSVSLTDDSGSPISRLNNLHGLYLYNVHVSSDSLNALGDCISGCISLQKLTFHFRYKPSDADEKPEQREASYNYLLRSIEAKPLLTYLRLHVGVGHQNYVLDLSKHDILQELHLYLPLTELHINTEQLVTCEVYKMYGLSAAAVSSLLAELHGAPVLETLALADIRIPPPRIDITALPLMTKFALWDCDLRDSTVTLTLPRLMEFTLKRCHLIDSTVTLTLPLLTEITLEHCHLTNSTVTLTLPRLTELTLPSCDLRESTVTVSPEMTSLKTIKLFDTTANIPCYRKLFFSISKLPQPITMELDEIDMTAEEWRKLLFDILGKLTKSIRVEMQECSGPSKEEWRNIVDYMKASPAFCVTHTELEWIRFGASISFDTAVA